MPDDSSPSRNPFVRFKHHIDQRIAAGLQSIFGLPSVVSQAFSLPQPKQQPEPTTLPSNADTATTTKMLPSEGGDNNTPSHDSNPFPSLETSLAALTGGTRSESLLAWRLFLTHSAYSPLLLDETFPHRPTPNGIPSHADPALYSSWADAFEDLLLASSARPMVELAARPRMRAEQLAGLFFSGTNGSGSWQWGVGDRVAEAAALYLRRLRRQRLDEVYFPYRDVKRGYISPGTMEEWVALRREETEREEERRRRWETIWRERAEEAEKDEGEKGERFGDMVEAVLRGANSLAKDVEGAVRETEGMVRELERMVKEGLGKNQDEDDVDTAKTEEDLYSSVRSAFRDGQESLSNFFKSLSDEREPRPDAQISGPQESTTQFKDGSTKTVTRNEYVDDTGAVHVKVVVSVKNAEGVEVSRSVQHSIRSQSQSQPKTTGTTINNDEEEPKHIESSEKTQDSKGGKKSGGWFWTR